MKKNETLVKRSRNELLDAFVLNGKDTFVDDTKNGLQEKLLGIVRFRGVQLPCAPLTDYNNYLFHELYYDKNDNEIHMFTKSISGIITRTGNDIDSIINDCLNYNEQSYLEENKIFAVYLKDCFITIGDDINSCFINEYKLQECK